MDWIEGRSLSGIEVEKREGKRKGGKPFIPLTDPQAVVVHTTEGPTLSGGVNTLLKKFSAPHFVVGEDRIVQMRPLNAQGASLADKGSDDFHANSVGWQIESVGFSKKKLHRLTPSTWKPLVAVCTFLHQEFGVPLVRPEGWLEDCSDITTILATNNTRRKSRGAIGFHGFLGHLDMPDQGDNWHWDPGAFQYTALFEEVSGDMPQFDERTAETLQRMADHSTGAAPGVDPVFAEAWEWAQDQRIFTQATKPDEYIRADRMAAILQRTVEAALRATSEPPGQ